MRNFKLFITTLFLLFPCITNAQEGFANVFFTTFNDSVKEEEFSDILLKSKYDEPPAQAILGRYYIFNEFKSHDSYFTYDKKGFGEIWLRRSANTGNENAISSLFTLYSVDNILFSNAGSLTALKNPYHSYSRATNLLLECVNNFNYLRCYSGLVYVYSSRMPTINLPEAYRWAYKTSLVYPTDLQNKNALKILEDTLTFKEIERIKLDEDKLFRTKQGNNSSQE